MYLQLRVLLALIAVGVVGVSAQTAAPTVTAEAQLRLQSFELRAENIALKIAALQAEFVKLQGEANTAAQSLKRDGYTLQRAENGIWAYVPAPLPTTKEPAK